MNSFITRCRLFLLQLKLHGARQLLVALVGGSVGWVGVAMVGLPGPTIFVIPLGLAILPSEFLRARRWLKRAPEMFRK